MTLASSLAETLTQDASGPAPAAAPEPDLLRFTTAGSVDDGKSTLIGRLLYETGAVPEDQLEAVHAASRRRGESYLNLALLTDGLRAEREQNITIDVAYRYFATPRRRFIIADTPGHLQYTRNMVTGASTAELAVVLVDARKGVLTQSRRHGFLSSLLGIPHVVVAVNKMDLVDYAEEVFEAIAAEYRDFSARLEVPDLAFVPVSALYGDNVVEKSARMPWYAGATLLHHLETVNVGAGRNLVDFRFPVQYVVRPHQDFRGLAGRVASGTVGPGEEVVVLPGGRTSRVRSVETADGPLAEAVAGDSVLLTLEDELDVGRGDMVVRRRNLPTVAAHLDALVCWLGERPLDPAAAYLLVHTTRTVQAFVTEVVYRIDVDTLHREPARTLEMNDIGRLQLAAAQPLCFDPYARNHATGSFILVDPHTHATVAAGMIRGEAQAPPRAVSPDVAWEEWNVPRAEREARNGHRAAVLWFTGLPGSGKSTIARALERSLFAAGCQTMLLDGDQVRHGLCGDLGFSAADRAENLRRAGEAARLFFEQGSIVLCTFVSPFAADRERVRRLLPPGRFLEVHVRASVETCAARDPKGLYARAARGELAGLTGVDAPYEAPDAPEIVADTEAEDVDAIASAILQRLRDEGILGFD
ncbi:MAG TPA: adenylyl-sulfate kinase [Longimicrobiaceae bacterium]|nr:adenylyl-sulfate kinase [Longimicrobiaceae bacterium]